MRLHRITLRDVRGVAERTVELPERGVVVIEGPNEIGKSTLLEAFDRLLDLKATSRSARAQALQPIGRDVGPFVEAELTIGGVRVRLAKQWLRSPRTELEVLGERPEQLTGSAAQARLEQLVAHLDTTLWDALRLAQSDDGTLVPLMSSGVLQEALDTAADAHLHDGDGEQVLGLVEEEYLRYFTERTGRPTGDYRTAIEAYHLAQTEVAEAHRRMVEVEDLLGRQERARHAAGRAEEEVAVAEAHLRTQEDAAAEVAGLVAAQERAAARWGRAREALESAQHAHRRRQQRLEGLAHLADVVAGHEQRRADLGAEGEAAQTALVSSQEGLVAADGAVESAEELLDQARAARELVERRLLLGRGRAELRGLEQLVRDLGEQLRGVREARDRRPRVPVSEAQRRQVERMAQEVEVLEARHQAASASVLVEAFAPGVSLGPATSASPSGAATPGRTDVEPGARTETSATDDLEVLVPGAARVVVRSPDAPRRRAELEQARAALEAALGDLGCTGVAEVSTRADATAEAAERLRQAERDLTSVLAAHGVTGHGQREAVVSGEVPATLLDRLATCRERVRDLEAEVADQTSDTSATGVHGQQPGDADAHAAADAQAAADAERAAGRQVREAREARRAASATAVSARERAAAVSAALDRLDGQLASERSRLDQEEQLLLRERSEQPDAELVEQVRVRQEELDAALGAARLADEAVRGADVPALTARVRAAHEALSVARGELDRSRELLHTLTGQVELAAGEGRQELYSLAEAALDDAERRLAGLDRRARAVRHLRSTLHEHRESAHRAYVRPFTVALERLGRQVYGPSFAVTVDERLTVRSRTLEGTTVPFEELSGGAKEQLGILARIAVAHLVDPAQGVPVVIDDALGYSDPRRLQQMGRVFALARGTAGEDAQVILLTCTPDRYAAIPDAHTVRLAAS